MTLGFVHGEDGPLWMELVQSSSKDSGGRPPPSHVTSDLVVVRWRTVVQPHAERDPRRRLLLEGFPHEPGDSLPPRPFVLGGAGVICWHSTGR